MSIKYTAKVATYSNAKDKIKRMEEIIGREYKGDYDFVQSGLSKLNDYFQVLFNITEDHAKSNEYFNCMVILAQAGMLLESFKQTLESRTESMQKEIRKQAAYIEKLESTNLQPLVDEAIEDYKAKIIKFIDEDLYDEYY